MEVQCYSVALCGSDASIYGTFMDQVGWVGGGAQRGCEDTMEFPDELLCARLRRSFHSGSKSRESDLLQLKILVGLTKRTQNAAFFERRGPDRKPWPQGKPLNCKK